MKTSLSKFCLDTNLPKATVHRRCTELGIDTSSGLDTDAIATLLHEFEHRIAEVQPEPPAEPVQSTVEVGNHFIVLSTPEQPEVYSLEKLRDSQAVSFEDPLALAAQYLEGAELVQAAMVQDISERQLRLQQTQQAKTAIQAKAQELQLEARLYQMQANSLNTGLSRETQELTAAMQQLKQLGKPADG